MDIRCGRPHPFGPQDEGGPTVKFRKVIGAPWLAVALVGPARAADPPRAPAEAEGMSSERLARITATTWEYGHSTASSDASSKSPRASDEADEGRRSRRALNGTLP
jgi:hypothetical protein